MTASVLALPKLGLYYLIHSKSSEYQVGFALFEKYPDGERKPVGYWSQSLQSADQTFSVSEKECLAVVWALTTIPHYVKGVTFTIDTDYSCLRWVSSISEPSGSLLCWRLRLSELDFEARLKKSRSLIHADGLLRLLTLRETQAEVNEHISSFLTEAFLSNHDDRRSMDYEDDLTLDVLIAQSTATAPVDQLKLIYMDELLSKQRADPFCTAICSFSNGGERVRFCLDKQKLLV